MKTVNKLWIGIAILIILSPLGLILPEHFKAGPGWGEGQGAGIWKAPMPDYFFKSWAGKGLPQLSFAYIISAVSGIAVIIGIVLLIGRVLSKKKG